MSKKWNPLHDLMLLQDKMNRLFEDVTERQGRVETEADMERADWYPNADIYDHDEKYVIAIDLPGIDRSNLEISIDNDRLLTKGTRSIGESSSTRKERPAGRFLRAFNVPSSVDQEQIQAEYKDGVLEVSVPKRKEQKARRIDIKVA